MMLLNEDNILVLVFFRCELFLILGVRLKLFAMLFTIN